MISGYICLEKNKVQTFSELVPINFDFDGYRGSKENESTQNNKEVKILVVSQHPDSYDPALSNK